MKTNGQIKISTNLILSFYLIIPISFICIFYDQLFLKGNLRDSLPFTPENLFLFNLIFVSPHIIANSFSLFDREYILFYKEKISITLPLIILLGFAAPYVLGANLFGIIFSVWTMKHVVNQQFAIAPFFTKLFNRNYYFWRWLGICLGVLAYAGLSPDDIQFKVRTIVLYAWPIFSIPFIILTIKLFNETSAQKGKWFILLNFTMIQSSILLYLFRYSFFAIIIPRIIHDFTAFTFYILHDINRNSEIPHNYIYKLFYKIKIPILVLCPLLAIVIAFPFQLIKLSFVQLFLTVLGIVHYYIESFTWKSGSIHRKQIIIE
jgi:hypothetical protein